MSNIEQLSVGKVIARTLNIKYNRFIYLIFTRS